MRIYAERPGRALLQVLADLAVVAWVYYVVDLARTVEAAVLALQAPGQRLTGAGDSIRSAFDDAARTASGVPFVGDDLARALGNGSAAGDSLAASGRDLTAGVASTASGIWTAILVVGVVPIVVVWLTLRVRWVLAARSATIARAAGPDLLALHALTRRSTAALLHAAAGRNSTGGSGSDTGTAAPDPAAAWRRGDREVVAALAAVELAALGLRAPRSDERVSPPR